MSGDGEHNLIFAQTINIKIYYRKHMIKSQNQARVKIVFI